MTITHDYYLSDAKTGNKLKHNNEPNYLDELIKEIGKNKKESLDKQKEKWINNYQIFYPQLSDIDKKNLPAYTALLKISFSLKKPYTSKEEGEFHILNGRITENPIVRDSLTGLPLVKPSTWKGHLRFAADKVESDEWSEEEKKAILKRLFAQDQGEK